jgi:hypothetical protein
VAVTFSVGGAAATWVRAVEQTRENRAAWRDLLRDVVEVDQTLAVARQLIAAHKTARTYSEQYANIPTWQSASWPAHMSFHLYHPLVTFMKVLRTVCGP